MPRIIGIGQSHVIAFNQAADHLSGHDADRLEYIPICFAHAEYHPPFVMRDGASVPNDAWVATLRRFAGDTDTHVVLVLPGAEWWHWSLTPGPEPFDFVDPLADDPTPLQGVVVPYDLVTRKARTSFRYISQVVDVVRGIADFPIHLSPPPPPMRRIDLMYDRHANPGPDPDPSIRPLQPLLRKLAPTLERYGFRSDSFRMKTWRVCMRVVQDMCEEMQVRFLSPPPGGVDADGFLLPAMISDFVHANGKWGALQLEHLLTVVHAPQGALS